MKINSSARKRIFSKKWVKLTQGELFSLFHFKSVSIQCLSQKIWISSELLKEQTVWRFGNAFTSIEKLNRFLLIILLQWKLTKYGCLYFVLYFFLFCPDRWKTHFSFLFCQPGPTNWKTHFSFADPARTIEKFTSHLPAWVGACADLYSYVNIRNKKFWKICLKETVLYCP